MIMTIVLKRKINYHLLQTYLPSGWVVATCGYSHYSLLSLPRPLRDRVLAVAVPPARVHPRQDGHGHDHPPHPRIHVRRRAAEHTQGQTCKRWLTIFEELTLFNTLGLFAIF